MIRYSHLVVFAVILTWASSLCADVGAVLYLQKSATHISHINVPNNAIHHYFGFLEGPAIENKYCAFRTYVDSANRNSVDFITKFQEVPVLHFFDNPTVDEHATWPWGTDCFPVGKSMGLGAFRLFYNNQWLNPQLGHNLDSLVITILDSSVQTPKFTIGYWGWDIGTLNKITVTWTISTNFADRAAHCEVAIHGAYTGKVVVGIEPISNPAHPVTIIKDSAKAILATIGVQGGLLEGKNGFTDTMVLAVRSDPGAFSSWARDAYNLGMVLTPDANQKVKWDIGYCEAREVNPLFRDADWQNKLFGIATGVRNREPDNAGSPGRSLSPVNNPVGYVSISGRRIPRERVSAIRGIMIQTINKRVNKKVFVQ